MYSIYLEDFDHPLWVPTMQDERYVVTEPKLKREINKAASLTFRVPPQNLQYNSLHTLTSTVLVRDDSREDDGLIMHSVIFRGRVLKMEAGLYGELLVTCEGDLGFLNDSYVEEGHEFAATTDEDFLAELVAIHNAQVNPSGYSGPDRRLLCEPGEGHEIPEAVTDDYMTCLDALMEYWKPELDTGDPEGTVYFINTYVTKNATTGALESRIGGVFESDPSVSQALAVGENVLDITDLVSGEDIFTIIVPLGADEETDETDEDGNPIRRPLTIYDKESTDDHAYQTLTIFNSAGIANFGRITKVVRFSDIRVDDETPHDDAVRALYDKGVEALSEAVFEAKNVEVEGIDLLAAGYVGLPLQLGFPTQVIHWLLWPDAPMTAQCRKITLDMANPEKSKYEFLLERPTLTGITYSDSRTASKALETATTAVVAATEAAAAAASASADGIEYIRGTWTSTSGTWTGVTKDAALYDGKKIILYMPYGGSGNATLNLTLADGTTTTGAKPVYITGTTRVSTQFPQYTELMLIYFSAKNIAGTNYDGWWSLHGEAFESTNARNVRLNITGRTAKTATGRYKILLTQDIRYLLPVNSTDNNTGTGKTLTTEAFDPFGEVYYYSSDISRNAGATAWGTALAPEWSTGGIDLRYSFNTGSTLTSGRSVFLVCEPQSDGKVKLHTSPIAQAYPSTEDGLVYKYLGQANSSTNMVLALNKPCYEYRDGKVRLYVG